MKSTGWTIEYKWMPPACDRPPFKEVEWLQWMWPFEEKAAAEAEFKRLIERRSETEFRLVEREPEGSP